jgi:GDP-4-dehydro-6-deoxy-D-mannose reductase
MVVASSPVALITGADGFVGRHLARELEISGLSPFGIDISARQKNADVFPDSRWATCDITSSADISRIIRNIAPAVVFHLAGIAYVPWAEAHRQETLRINVGGTLNILEAAAAQKRPPHVMIISSSDVYGRVPGKKGPITEAFPLEPANFYAGTKAAAEGIAWPFFERGEVPLTILRPFSHIGPGQAPTFVTSDFARQVARITLSLAKPEVHVGNIDVFRSFTDVRDMVRGYRLAYETLKPGSVYHLANETPVSIRSILEEFIRLSGKEIKIVRDPKRFRKADIRKVTVDSGRFRRATGWEPTIPLKQTLKDIFEDWLQKIKKGT